MEGRTSFESEFVKFAIEVITIAYLFNCREMHWYIECCAVAGILAIIVSSIYYFCGNDDNSAWARMFLSLLIFAGVTFLLPAALIVLIVVLGIWVLSQLDSGQAEKKKRATVVEHYECSKCGYIVGENNTRCPNCGVTLR